MMREAVHSFIGETWHVDWCGVRLFCCRFDAQAWQPSDDAFLRRDAYQSLQHAVVKRKAEFVAGRRMATRALAYLGYDALDIGIGAQRAPCWPLGVVGSISHHSSLAVSSVRLASDGAYLGLDVEPVMPDSQARQLQYQVCRADELAKQHHSGLSLAEFITLVFSAKESLFKAVYPQVKRYLEFTDAKLIAIDSQSLTLMLSIPTWRASYRVAYWQHSGEVFTLATGAASPGIAL